MQQVQKAKIHLSKKCANLKTKKKNNRKTSDATKTTLECRAAQDTLVKRRPDGFVFCCLCFESAADKLGVHLLNIGFVESWLYSEKLKKTHNLQNAKTQILKKNK